MIALIAAIGVIVVTLLTLGRLFAGPTLYDRALVASGVIIKAALVCTALGVAAGQAMWIDVSFALLLGALVLNAAVFKFFRSRTFQAPLARGQAR